MVLQDLQCAATAVKVQELASKAGLQSAVVHGLGLAMQNNLALQEALQQLLYSKRT